MERPWWSFDDSLAETLAEDTKSASAKATAELVAGNLSEGAALKFNRRIQNLVDSHLKVLRQAAPAVVCKPGCYDCCHSAVPSLPSEAVPIVRQIKAEWSREEIDDLIHTLRGQVERLMDDFDCWQSRFREPCPLLYEGHCTVYENRPLFCRENCSFDVSLCQEWKTRSPDVTYLPAPHGERLIREAVVDGMKPHVPPDLATPMPLAFHLLAQLVPGEFPTWRKERPEWLPELPPDRPLAGAPYEPLVYARDSQPYQQWTGRINPADLAESIVGLDVSMGYDEVGEFDEYVGRVKLEMDRIEATEFKSSAMDALNALGVNRLGCLMYSDLDLKPLTMQFGRILRDKIALRTAPELTEPMGPRRPGPLRFGLVSSRLGSHSSSSWALGWLKHLRCPEVETYAFNCRKEREDTTHAFREAVDHFYTLDGDRLSVARFIRQHDLDYILFTELGDGGMNLQLAMFRLGRVQAAGWGCPYSSGMPYVDEYLSAELWETPESDAHYSERLIRLPKHGVTYPGSKPLLMDYGREKFGLPAGHLVVVAQNLSKWRPEDDDLIEEVAGRLDNPLHVIEFGVDSAIDAFKRRMERRKARIVFLPPAIRYLYKRMIGLFDLSLDAPVFHGGHSSFATLAAGTPILSLAGRQLRSRMGVAFQTMSQLPDAAVNSREEYLARALDKEWAADARRRLDTSELFDNAEPALALRQHLLATSSSA